MDGSKQHTYDRYDKSYGSPPTLAMNSIFLGGVINAKELRAIAILDIGNTFLHAENDKRIIMHLCGRLAKMKCKFPRLYTANT